MANQFNKVMTCKLFKNERVISNRTHSNSNWVPMVNKEQADIVIKAGKKYSASLFENDSGGFDFSLSEIINTYEDKMDPISEGVSQPGMKPIAQDMEKIIAQTEEKVEQKKEEEKKLDEDDIPF